jgi:hypothetical protein
MKRRTLAFAVLALGAAGCGEPKPATFHGTVSFAGKPLTSGVIYFLGPEPKMQMGMGTIRDDGTYTATDVPVGEVRVSFQAPGVPKKFGDPNTSELKYTIGPDTKSLDIDIPDPGKK